MKTALILNSPMRTYKKMYDNLLKNIIEPNNCDIYIHTSLCDQYKKDNKKDLFKSITDLYKEKLKGILIEDDSEINNNIEQYFYTGISYYRKNDIKSAYRLKKCFIMIEHYENKNNFKYTYVIKYRPDISINKKLTLSDIKDINSNKYLYSLQMSTQPWAILYNDSHDNFIELANKNYDVHYNFKNKKFTNGDNYKNTPIIDMFIFGTREYMKPYLNIFTIWGKYGTLVQMNKERQIRLNLYNNDIKLCLLDSHIITIHRHTTRAGKPKIQVF